MQIGNQPVPISVNSKDRFKKVEKQKVFYLSAPQSIISYTIHDEFIAAKSGFLAINCKMQIGNQPIPISVNSKGGFKKVKKKKKRILYTPQCNEYPCFESYNRV